MSASAMPPAIPCTGNCTNMLEATTTTAMAATNGRVAESRFIFLSWVMEPVGLPLPAVRYRDPHRAGGRSASGGRLVGQLLGDLLLQHLGALRQIVGIGLGQEGVEAAAML